MRYYKSYHKSYHSMLTQCDIYNIYSLCVARVITSYMFVHVREIFEDIYDMLQSVIAV